MGLLDGGLAASFASTFGAYFLPGTLHRATRSEADNGDVTVTWSDTPIKGQVDQISEAMRVQAGYTAKQQRLIVLQAGVSPTPNSNDEITLGGQRWTIAGVDSDPAGTHWLIRGQKA